MKSLGKSLFVATSTKTRANPRVSYQRVSAADMALPESWFRDAIFDEPELVIGPCREAGRVPTDEMWLPWATEFNFGAGPVDVLLISSRGRPAIIETKLSSNPEKRREVIAQILDYALSMRDALDDDLPPLPSSNNAPDLADLQECLLAGRFLLIVAGDELDPRAIRLSEALLAGHLVSEWDLAMVDLNVYRSTSPDDQLLLVPELRGVLRAEPRQVVRVQIEGETQRARILGQCVPTSDFSAARRDKFNSVDDFLARVHERSPDAEAAIRRIVERFQQIDRATESRHVLALQTASANLYWKSATGALLRIFGMSESGRFRVMVGYVLGEAREDVAAAIRELSKPVVAFGPGESSAALFVDQNNVSAVLSVIDAVVAAVARMES